MTQTINHSTKQNDVDLQEKIIQVFKLFEKTFSDYSLDEVFLSFNGGKDCTVLLDLIQKYLNSVDKFKGKKIRIIYIQPAKPFEEVENFVNLCEKIYNIKIEKRPGNLKKILEEVCNDKKLKSVIMGCRRTDPHCENLQHMQLTDSTWPKLMRVNPLLDWTCQDIWNYILETNTQYCSLYDHGYTSLGDRLNTKPNPHLKKIDEITGEISYRPAHELLQDELERAGRT